MGASIELVQKLRDLTGAGVVECKKALDETKGDFDAAVTLIHERGQAKMEKRAGRTAGAGMVQSYVHNDRIGVLVDVRAETDFVVRSDPFRELAKELAMQISAMAPANVEELLAQPYIRDDKRTVADLVKDVIARTGENVKVNTFYRIEL